MTQTGRMNPNLCSCGKPADYCITTDGDLMREGSKAAHWVCADHVDRWL